MYTTTNTNSNKRDYGDGSIRYVEKKKLWEARTSNGRRGDGKPDRISRYAPTKAEAKKLLKQMVKVRDASLNRNVQSKTMTDYYVGFLNNKRAEIKENSALRIRDVVETYILPEIGFVRLGDLTYDDCDHVINKVISEGYSLSIVQKVYDALNACLKWAVKKRDLQFNPMAALNKPTIKDERIKPPKEMKPFTAEESVIFMNEAKRHHGTGKSVYRLGWLLILKMATGLRIGELLALLWADVDFKSRTILVRQTTVITEKLTSNKGARQLTTKVSERTKTHAGYREIGLNDIAYEALMELRNVTGSFERVAATQTGGLVTHRNILKTYHGLLRKIDLPQRGLHDLRHTFATHLFLADVDVAIISKLLGHRSVEFTIDTYIHIIEELKRKGVYALDFLAPHSKKSGEQYG